MIGHDLKKQIKLFMSEVGYTIMALNFLALGMTFSVSEPLSLVIWFVAMIIILVGCFFAWFVIRTVKQIWRGF